MPEKPEERGRCRNEAKSQQKGQAAAGMGYVVRGGGRQGRDLLDVSVPCFLRRGDNGRDSGESP